MTQVWGYQFQGQELRVVCIQPDTLRFVLEDVCNILELDVWSVVSHLHISDINRAGIEDEHGFQVVSLVSVAGLFQVVALSKKEVAEPFWRWVTAAVVLPQLRRVKPPSLSEDQVYLLLYLIAALLLSLMGCLVFERENFANVIVASFLGVGLFRWLVAIIRNPKQELPVLGYAAVVFWLMATFWWLFIIK